MTHDVTGTKYSSETRSVGIRLLIALMLTALAGLMPTLAQEPETPDAITAASARRVQFSVDLSIEGVVNDLAFSPDGALLLTAGQDTAVRLWSVEDNEQIAEAFEHFSFVKGAAFAESLMATGSWDRTLILWQLDDGALRAQATIGGFDGVVEHLALSPDGSRISFGVGDGRVRVADAATGAIQYELSVGALRVTAVAYSPDGTQIAAAGGFPAAGALVFNAATGAREFELPHPGVVSALAYSPDGAVLAVAGEDGTVSLWRGDEQIAVLDIEEWVTDLAFSPDGSALVVARQDGIMTLWDVREPAAPEMAVALVAADSAINAVAFSPDGARMATAAEDGSVRLWEAQD